MVGGYRFGFGGQEKTDELKGEGNHYTAMFWEYDPRLGRRWNVDPMAAWAPGWSPYRGFFNNPLYWTDPDGLFETRREARRHRRKNEPSLNRWNSRITKKRDGSFQIKDRRSDYAISKERNEIIRYASASDLSKSSDNETSVQTNYSDYSKRFPWFQALNDRMRIQGDYVRGGTGLTIMNNSTRASAGSMGLGSASGGSTRIINTDEMLFPSFTSRSAFRFTGQMRNSYKLGNISLNQPMLGLSTDADVNRQVEETSQNNHKTLRFRTTFGTSNNRRIMRNSTLGDTISLEVLHYGIEFDTFFLINNNYIRLDSFTWEVQRID